MKTYLGKARKVFVRQEIYLSAEVFILYFALPLKELQGRRIEFRLREVCFFNTFF